MRLCERPGCSSRGAVVYGMEIEDLVFWLAPVPSGAELPANVLCVRHADAMVVPRGWTLDDRRDADLHLFNPRLVASSEPVRPAERRRRPPRRIVGEQLQIDGTGEIARPEPHDAEPHMAEPWTPTFDVDDDLGGLLDVSSPLLARAFRGERRRVT